MVITIQLDESRLPRKHGPYSRSTLEREITVSGETHKVEIKCFVPSTEDEREFFGIMSGNFIAKATQILTSALQSR